MNYGLLIISMALVTFSIRYVLIALSGKINLSPKMIRALEFVPPAVLTAIITPTVLIPDGETLFLSWNNPRLVGACIAVIVGFWRGNLLLTIVAGMAAFWIWQGLLGFD
ncbi:MAG: AzlD domain-containing protein [Thainema sp.]